MAYQRKQYRNRTLRGGTPGQATFTGAPSGRPAKRYADAPEGRNQTPFDNYLLKNKVVPQGGRSKGQGR